MESNGTRLDTSLVAAVTAIVLAAVCILLPIPGLIDLYGLPDGTACRPMGQAMAMFVTGMAGPAIVLLLAGLAMFFGRKGRPIAAIAAVLAFVPLPMQLILVNGIVRSHHLILEP